MEFLLYLALGALVGVLAGLFGVGGGLIIVPVLIFSFEARHFSADVLTHMAVGTSLATIFFTSLSSTRAHHRRGAVLWPVVFMLAVGIAIGTVLGVKTISYVSGNTLQKIIAGFLIVASIQMSLSLNRVTNRQLPHNAILACAGVVIGWASAMFGIGGGSITVPYLNWCNVRIQQAVATSAACGIPIAIVGAASNMIEGWGHENLPEWSTGYIYWPAVIGIALTSLLTAKLGVKLAHSLSPIILRRIFSLLLLAVGARLWMGV
jgi:uncharacterized protein